VLEGFRVGAVLGEGGSGTVYAATLEDGTEVAVKVLRADLALTESEVRRFLAEATLVQRIAHPSVVPVLRSGVVADGRPYLVMPRLHGETLATRLRRGKLAMREALAFLEQLAGAIETLHAAGIIHRDLKPENIFLVDGERVVLLDFGIAKDAAAAPSTTTTEGRVRGTPAYMAPERFFGAPASVRSDVYELAVILYEMLAGGLPWTNPDDVEARLRPQPGDLPRPVWAVLQQALGSNTEKRPASAIELSAAIGAAAAAPPAPEAPFTQTLDGVAAAVSRAAPSVERGPARRLPTRALVAGAGAVVVAGVVLAIAVRRDRPSAGDAPAAAVTVDARGSFCRQLDPPPAFCADFESPGDFRDGFYNAGKSPDPGEMGGGTVRVSETAHPGSRSLEVTAPALVAASNKASAVLFAELASPIRYAVVTLNLRIATELFADERALAVLLTINFGPAGAIDLVRRRAGTQLVVHDGTTSVDKALLGTTLPVGTWKTVRFLIHNYAIGPDGRGDVVVMLDGLAAKLPLPVSLQQVDSPPRVNVGIVVSRGPMEPLAVDVDDLAVTVYDGPDPAGPSASPGDAATGTP